MVVNMAFMSDSEFLNWLADRLVNVYGESENVDFVQKLRKVAGFSGREHKVGTDCWCNVILLHVNPGEHPVLTNPKVVSKEKEHELSEDCWCDPKVEDVPPRRKKPKAKEV